MTATLIPVQEKKPNAGIACESDSVDTVPLTEERAFAHWQFAVLGVAILGGFLGFLNGRTLGNAEALAFLATGCALLLVSAVTFGAGRMEVGDEMWHLKHHVPILRRVGEGLPFADGACGRAIGVSTRELLARVPSAARAYVFAYQPWTRATAIAAVRGVDR